MGAFPKYMEDNIDIAGNRLRDMESSAPCPKVPQSSLQKPISKKEMRQNYFSPKKGHLEIYHHRNEITMRFKQYLYEEWRKFLYSNGWRYSSDRNCWIKKYSSANFEFAYKFISGKEYKDDYTPDDLYIGDMSLMFE